MKSILHVVPDEGTEVQNRLCLKPGALRPGNRVRLLRDGAEAYPSMLAAIARAERHILLEMYTFADDSVGRKFAEALSERAAAGVEVRILYDAGGSRETPREFFGRLRAAGARVAEFRPLIGSLRRFRLPKRNHRKLLVVDGHTAFVGGLNLASSYAPIEEGGLGWRDTQVELQGPVVADLTAMFLDLWRRERLGAPGSDPVPDPPPVGGVPALVLSSHALRNRWEIGSHYRYAISRAQERIWIANAYFLPSARFRRELRRAAHRGVDVRILVPARSDVAPALYAAQRSFARYLRSGIRLYEWSGPMMHAKTALIDSNWVTVGSYNIDHLSLFRNFELTAVVVDREVGAEMRAMFEVDFGKCRELKLEEWRRRGWKRRVLEFLCHPWRGFF
jgi:cardiolipin synthase A/B